MPGGKSYSAGKHLRTSLQSTPKTRQRSTTLNSSRIISTSIFSWFRSCFWCWCCGGLQFEGCAQRSLMKVDSQQQLFHSAILLAPLLLRGISVLLRGDRVGNGTCNQYRSGVGRISPLCCCWSELIENLHSSWQRSTATKPLNNCSMRPASALPLSKQGVQVQMHS